MKDASGRLLTQEKDILNRWKEYFAELFNPTSGQHTKPSEPIDDEINDISPIEVTTAIKALKSGKAAGIDEIRPEMLKSLNCGGINWLTRIYQIVWKTGKAPAEWQTGIVVPIFKKSDQKECSNYRGITLLSLPGKVFARIIERRCRDIVEPNIQETQCEFRAGRGTTDQIFTLQQILEESWEFGKPVYLLFIDLEKAYDRVPFDLLWKTLKEYGIRSRLLSSIQSLYNNCKICVRTNSNKSDYFQVQVGLRQECVLSPSLFLIFMDKISRKSFNSACIEIGDVQVDSLLFADDIVRLAESSNGLQSAFNRFQTICSAYGMKISTTKTELMVNSRESKQYTLYSRSTQVNQLRNFKYLGVLFSDDGKQDGEIDRRIGAATSVLPSLYRSIVTKAELSTKAKMAIFKIVYRPTLIYGHEKWILPENTRSRIQAAEMRSLRRVADLKVCDQVKSSSIRESLQIEPLLIHIERSQLRWLGHVLRMPPNRLPNQVFQAAPTGRRPVGPPRTSWRK